MKKSTSFRIEVGIHKAYRVVIYEKTPTHENYSYAIEFIGSKDNQTIKEKYEFDTFEQAYDSAMATIKALIM